MQWLCASVCAFAVIISAWRNSWKHALSRSDNFLILAIVAAIFGQFIGSAHYFLYNLTPDDYEIEQSFGQRLRSDLEATLSDALAGARPWRELLVELSVDKELQATCVQLVLGYGHSCLISVGGRDLKIVEQIAQQQRPLGEGDRYNFKIEIMEGGRSVAVASHRTGHSSEFFKRLRSNAGARSSDIADYISGLFPKTVMRYDDLAEQNVQLRAKPYVPMKYFMLQWALGGLGKSAGWIKPIYGLGLLLSVFEIAIVFLYYSLFVSLIVMGQVRDGSGERRNGRSLPNRQDDLVEK
ncbi:MAG: hypothetical protein IPK27_06390 [Rhodanobacteraceae bacterium]|nr:hypothetical protein [Rhodanobacteraceae bacterium]